MTTVDDRHPTGPVHLGLAIKLSNQDLSNLRRARLSLDKLVASYAFHVRKGGDRYEFYLLPSLKLDPHEVIHEMVCGIVHLAGTSGCEINLIVRDLDSGQDWDDKNQCWLSPAQARPMSISHLQPHPGSIPALISRLSKDSTDSRRSLPGSRSNVIQFPKITKEPFGRTTMQRNLFLQGCSD